MEEYAFILDYLALGSNINKKEPLCYAIGADEFKLFELVPKQNAMINLDDMVYIGKDANLRKEIDHVKRRISFDELTATAVAELEFVVKDIVIANEAKYVKFFNEAQSISIKKHLLEELPGLGKKTVTEILDARKAGNFTSFEDIKARVPAVKDPVKLITDRILLEIKDRERRHYLFIVR